MSLLHDGTEEDADRFDGVYDEGPGKHPANVTGRDNAAFFGPTPDQEDTDDDDI